MSSDERSPVGDEYEAGAAEALERVLAVIEDRRGAGECALRQVRIDVLRVAREMGVTL